MRSGTAPEDWSRFEKEAADPHCMDFAAAAERLRPLPWHRLAVLGDSVTAGVRDPHPGYWDASFSERLRLALASTRTDFDSVNLATPYLRVDEIRAQQLDRALAFRPDVVLVSAGGNDAFAPYDPAVLRQRIARLLRPLAEAGALVVTVGLFDLARSGLVRAERAAAMAARFDEFDRVSGSITAELGGIHVDTHRHPLAANPDIYAADRVHANARGHAVAFSAIVKAVTTRQDDQPSRATAKDRVKYDRSPSTLDRSL